MAANSKAKRRLRPKAKVLNNGSAMTTDELASFLKVAPGTPEYWRRCGLGPRYLKVGPRNVRYLPQDVEAWLDNASVK